MRIKYADIRNIFQFFNERDFNGLLSIPDFIVQPDSETFGCAWIPLVPNHKVVVTLSPSWIRTWEDLVVTILHEMVHIWQYEVGATDTHGHTFKEWTHKFELKYGVTI